MDGLTAATYAWCERPLPEEGTNERKGLLDLLRRKR
jgi:hypothetical protein